MEIDEGLAQRVRQTLFELAEFADISERKMFGGLGHHGKWSHDLRTFRTP